MSQDVDGLGLIWLLWVTWIYWCVYRWLSNLSSLEQLDKEYLKRILREPSANANAISDATGTTASEEFEAFVSEILRRDGVSTLDDFLTKALAAYETIISAFDSADRAKLRTLVAPEVYDTFSAAIADREAQGKNTETVFSEIEPPEIVDGFIDETHMEVSVRFAGESFKLSRNADGEIIGGRTDKCRTVDIWTFERMLSPHESGWRVVATETGTG